MVGVSSAPWMGELAWAVKGQGAWRNDQALAVSDTNVLDQVILSTGNPFPNPVGLGDVLADYVDQGGGVVQTVATFVDGLDVQGRFMDEGYSAFDLGTGPIGTATLGTFDATHPIMDGVTTVWGDALATAPLAAGAQWVADWNIGEAFVATQGNQVAGVNIYVATSGYWMGEVPLVLHNAAAWVSGSARWFRRIFHQLA